jgi:hypothetical protein
VETGQKVELTREQAERLLAPLGAVSVLDVTVAATINDVFKVSTQEHGTYYVKFHTSPWYARHPDAYFVVERECAVCELLRKRGMPLPYRAWGDFSREVAPRSVFISEELGGLPAPDALRRFPDQAPLILRALGRYLQRLHSIEFERAGFIGFPHAYFAPPEGRVPCIHTWDRQAYHRAEHQQRKALRLLGERSSLLPPNIVPKLREMFESLADVVRNDYQPPRFTVANCHAYHFHVEKRNGEWDVLGLYDFEAASAGAPVCDLVEFELTLTPATSGIAWRKAFFDGYGSWPSFEGYKRRVLCDLLFWAGVRKTPVVPEREWLYEAWPRLIAARDWAQLQWLPERRSGDAQQARPADAEKPRG